ncbi:MAG: iron ABC transporter permease [Oscillospiraceae bacterium]|nr:iron ABC transporter permease [Oscillospiraceae bacterium]
MNASQRKHYTVCFVFLALLLVLFLTVNLLTGSTAIPPREVLRALFGTGEQDTVRSIVRNIRLPRLLSALILGGALSVAGFQLQTFFANPIAGPFVLGISSGSKLLVALVMIACLRYGMPVSSGMLIGAAFLGAMLCMGIILLAAGRVRNMAILIVCGVMIGYICTAITDILVTFADDSNIVNLHNWSMGSFSGIGWSSVRTASVTVAFAMVCAVFLAKPMGAYQLGEAYARSMGVEIRRFRVALILLSSLLSACVTAFSGPISFVGVAVPHLMKNLFRTAKPLVMIPACFLGGGVFCLFCDLIARTLFAPAELSISSVTAVFGVPVVLSMLLSRRRR